MPVISWEMPRFLGRLFPNRPVAIGPLVFQRNSLVEQRHEDARLIDRLLRAVARSNRAVKQEGSSPRVVPDAVVDDLRQAGLFKSEFDDQATLNLK